MRIGPTDLHELKCAALDPSPVAGLTHSYYRYPARFSPIFARTAIDTLTSPGDLVLDPFAGGGTSLVEARALGRPGIGFDISPLAVFVSKAKTTILSRRQRLGIRRWAEGAGEELNLRRRSGIPSPWVEEGYQRNLNTRGLWPIRKSLELGLEYAERLATRAERRFARCVLLRAGQWALDCKQRTPTAPEFRMKLQTYAHEMIQGMEELSAQAHGHWLQVRTGGFRKSHVIVTKAEAAANFGSVRRRGAPRLIVTSPPYPGVHVVYHRWQVGGRRETPAPFWIAGKEDGRPERHYALGERREPGLGTYFANLKKSFRAIHDLSDRSTLIIQLVAFSDPSWQLEKYLEVLHEVGLVEMEIVAPSCDNGRILRPVPNRKWYARQLGETSASQEVLLIHRKRDP